MTVGSDCNRIRCLSRFRKTRAIMGLSDTMAVSRSTIDARITTSSILDNGNSGGRALQPESHSDPLSEGMARELALSIEDDTGLTRREREMLWLELQGVGPVEIAEQCNVARSTVYVTLRNARRKIQLVA